MFNEVNDVTQAQERLLNHQSVLVCFALACAVISRWMVSIVCQLVDGFSNDLLEGREEALVEEDLGKLRLVDQVGLDEKIANGIHRHQVDITFELVGELEHASYRALIVEQMDRHTWRE